METSHQTIDRPDAGLVELYGFMASREFVAGRAELLRNGFSAHRLRSWKRSGRLVKSFRGVYSYGRDIQTRNAALRAGLLVAGPGSALTGRTALEKWGAVKARREIPLLVEVATESARTGTHQGLSPALRNTQVQVVQRGFELGDVRKKDGLGLLSARRALPAGLGRKGFEEAGGEREGVWSGSRLFLA